MKQVAIRSVAVGTHEKRIPLEPLLDAIRKSGSYELIQERNGDHYYYEKWWWGDMEVHLCETNLSWLKETEAKEEKIYVREFILFEDGRLTGGWFRTQNLLEEN